MRNTTETSATENHQQCTSYTIKLMQKGQRQKGQKPTEPVKTEQFFIAGPLLVTYVLSSLFPHKEKKNIILANVCLYFDLRIYIPNSLMCCLSDSSCLSKALCFVFVLEHL